MNHPAIWEQKNGLRFRRPLRVLELFPDSYAGGGGVGGFFSRCGARSTWLTLCHTRSFSGWRVYLLWLYSRICG